MSTTSEAPSLAAIPFNSQAPASIPTLAPAAPTRTPAPAPITMPHAPHMLTGDYPKSSDPRRKRVSNFSMPVISAAVPPVPRMQQMMGSHGSADKIFIPVVLKVNSTKVIQEGQSRDHGNMSDAAVAATSLVPYQSIPPRATIINYVKPNSSNSMRKRGRPRKYEPLLFTPTPIPTPTPTPTPIQQIEPQMLGSTGSEPTHEKSAGTPRGSTDKEQIMESLGPLGSKFTPHLVMVKPGEDVALKIMTFFENGPRVVCVISATGAISSTTLCQSVISGGTATYEGGPFGILSLYGSYLFTQSGSQQSRTGGLTVTLNGLDGRPFGGLFAGPLLAATQVQLVLASFIPDGHHEESYLENSPAPP